MRLNNNENSKITKKKIFKVIKKNKNKINT